jgi:Fe-S-cluster-containing dehydrogenase component
VDRPYGRDEPRDAPAVPRRDLLRLMGGGLALAAGCSQPPTEKILPFAVQPPEQLPGVPLHYATSMVIDGLATGLLVASHDGRPTKIEGNPEHPASLGATRAWEQAAILGLYDPDRAKAPSHGGMPASWQRFQRDVAAAPDQRIAFILPPQSSPLIGEIIARIRERHPRARFAFWAPLARRGAYAAARLLYGRPLDVQYAFDRAKVVLALDADFTNSMAMSIRWARDFAASRRPAPPYGDICRLYEAGPTPTPTASLADHRLAIPASLIPQVGRALLVELANRGSGVRPSMAKQLDPPAEPVRDPIPVWLRAAARDLVAAAGECIVIAGDRQSRDAHVLAHMANAALGNFDRTVRLTETAIFEPENGSLEEIAGALDAGEVDTVVVLDANPAYAAPPSLDFARLLRKAKQSVHLSLYRDETSEACRWFLPAAHFLESWGDARAYDGTLSFQQPLIRPLYAGRSVTEVLAAFAGMTGTGYELLRESVRARIPGDFESGWFERIRLGFEPNSAFAGVTTTMATAAAAEIANAPPSDRDAVEVNFEAPLHDGRFSNNAWLLELPHPITKLTWDNAALISPRAAERLRIDSGRVLEIAVAGRKLRAPALIVPGHADNSVTVALGYGRGGSESVARDVGVDAYALLGKDGALFATGVTLTATAERVALARTQGHFRQEGRELALTATLAELRGDPERFERLHEPPHTMLPIVNQGGDQWAITVDTSICTGCSACVIACQAENNIPVVGKDGVLDGREMHWLRIDTYLEGPDDAPEPVHQPMMCQHCEAAPCEYVCPVYATTHSPDGLNEMTYNRCIGTRFCSNNCPYKVRRFNWFDYNEVRDARTLQKNPDVTVRARGVMEKCTYCVQRVRRAEIAARVERRAIQPGEVVSACAQACPTGAIQFGSLRHAESAAVKLRHEPRAYAVLHEEGTRPRTLYLAKITNPGEEA